MTKLHCTLVFSAAVLLATSPAAAVDIIWTDNLTEQILRGAADGSGSASELFAPADYPGSPGSITPLRCGGRRGLRLLGRPPHRPDPAGRGRRQRVGQRAVRHRRLPRLARLSVSPVGLWRSTGASSTGADQITDQILRGAADGSGSASELFGIADYPGSPGGITPQFITVVPEPNTFALAALGLVGLAGYGWRRKREVAA